MYVTKIHIYHIYNLLASILTYFLESRLQIPTYLFRGSSPLSGSGVEIKGQMVPRAFLKDPGSGHRDIY